jgi:hypothetical protein
MEGLIMGERRHVLAKGELSHYTMKGKTYNITRHDHVLI